MVDMPATAPPDWAEVESRVHRPARGMLLAAGALFLAFGLIALLSYDRGASSISDRAYVVALGGIFFLIGCVVFTAAATTSAVYIRHAAAEVLANVPREPVLVEGANVHGRLTHELVETTDGWHFRPASRNWRNDRRFLLGFGVPFLLFAAGVLSWFLHRDGTARNWPLAILTGGFITVSIGGTVFWVMAAMLRWSYGRLPSLVIARGGEALAYEGPMPVDHNRDWLKYGFAGNPERQQLSIPRARLAAVQLCPWKFVMGGTHDRSITWAVQGLLVLSSDEQEHFQRLPILLSSDSSGAAQLMRRLADVLAVPYLFHADAAGWQDEEARAKTRRPLHSGGIVS